MYNETAIKVEHLSKKYPLRQPQTDEYGNVVTELSALKNLTFEIRKGESVGIIGRNGSGKSTLLKILAGISKPSTGKVEIRGRVASILDIGAGFHPELSGRENVFLSGQTLLGSGKDEIEKVFDEIVAFSGIRKFIDEPVKNYSNGMYLRLAFSIMAHLDFEVYLFDEVLGVGDREFREKCFEKIIALAATQKTFVLISHNPTEIARVCKSVYLLDSGTISGALTIDEALFTYGNVAAKDAVRFPEFVHKASVFFYDEKEEAKQEFLNTEPITISARHVFSFIPRATKIGIRLNDKLNNAVFNISPILTKDGIGEIDFSQNRFSVVIPAYTLNAGFYTVDVVYFDNEKVVDEIKNINYFKVNLAERFATNNLLGEDGLLMPFYDWKIE